MDIVERLRLRIHTSEDETALTDEAADEIERLQKEVMAWWKETEIMRSDLAVYSEEIERLREALGTICDGQRDADKSYAELFAEVKTEARAALKEGE